MSEETSPETSLELDVDTLGRGGEQVARVSVGTACGFTRSGGAPTITQDCRSWASFEREVGRLKGELDAVLEQAREHFGALGRPPEEQEAEAAARPEEASVERPHLDGEIQVGEVMTREVKTVGRNDPLSLADELMKQGRFRHVVVLDDDGRVAGVISHRDIFLGALAWAMGQGRTAHERALAASPAKDVMHANPASVDPNTSLREAADLMRERKIGCLPVLEGDALVGILTEGDFLALLGS